MVESFAKNITIIEERIRLLRDLKGISQLELAHELGVSRSVINSWENGYINISLRQLVKLSYYYKVPIDYILGLTTKFDRSIYDFRPCLDLKVLGNNIRKIRKLEQLTQEQLAKKIKSLRSCIGHYERGVRMMSTADLKDICNTFGYSADWCVGNTQTFIKREKKVTIKEEDIRSYIEV